MCQRRSRRTLPQGALFVVVVGLLASTCNLDRIAPAVTCEALRRLRLGLRETEVTAILGSPIDVIKGNGTDGLRILYDTEYDYVPDPSNFRVHLNFLDGQLVIAAVGTKRVLEDSEVRLLFTLDQNGVRETDAFKSDFCGHLPER